VDLDISYCLFVYVFCSTNEFSLTLLRRESNTGCKSFDPKRVIRMPKALSPLFPLEGLFGLIKPSGPASMILLDRLKPLFNESPLFVTDKDERQRIIDARKNASNAKGSKSKRKRRKDAVKIGQGGTLDPLADGVLGAYIFVPPPFVRSFEQSPS
jgi:hypothetical protein